MTNQPLFIVIEGLDGAGKTTASEKLAEILTQQFSKKVKRTYEPNNDHCGGKYIRKVLEKKITNFQHRTLALSFAANRLDHGDRLIGEWLERGEDHIILCDRYYLSSLVYQSKEGLSIADVMELNQYARPPDLIFFMNVSNETCYERMNVRNKPRELFEENLSETRDRYFEAIDFLRNQRGERIVEVDANGTVGSIVENMIDTINQLNISKE